MPKQNKSVLQKQYRSKELDGFSLVRAEIRHATRGEIDPKTRQDVLRKAARLIKDLAVLNAKLQHQLYKSCHTSSETPSSCAGALPTTISADPCVQDPYSPAYYEYEYFIEQPNPVRQLAGIQPTESHPYVTSTGYELCNIMPSGNTGITLGPVAYDQIISQVNPRWSSDRQYYNHHEQLYA
ncbi:uncharacterized protein EDB93DRAFT_1247059 [Suillus bovinus]|uniref:uncharacterized protein n=1 Tax=Suillus bovinus TaxID=48563 RepID=UPI001B867BC1|nr:uncharacterized protein EDB93DRAFT_1247059 [Suillus bovinus]KAG2156870.1 hypothetical protein EDB93DRAFT_1247059 [Suillus bovinus]